MSSDLARLSGQWVVDANRSESIEPLLKAFHVSSSMRQSALSVKFVQEIGAYIQTIGVAFASCKLRWLVGMCPPVVLYAVQLDRGWFESLLVFSTSRFDCLHEFNTHHRQLESSSQQSDQT
jgi:hypothetical protein